MLYRVIEYFEDLQDHDHKYRAGDYFPRPGFVVSEERLQELATSANRRGRPVIKAEEVAKKPEEAVEEPKEAIPEPVEIEAEEEPTSERKTRKRAKKAE